LVEEEKEKEEGRSKKTWWGDWKSRHLRGMWL